MLDLAIDHNRSRAPLGSADAVGADRRTYPRHTADTLPWLRSIRVKNGPRLWIVDLSAGGLQVEVENYPLRPGSLVTLDIIAQRNRVTAAADVLRSRVAALNSSIKYRGALAFKAALDLSALAEGLADAGSSSLDQASIPALNAMLRVATEIPFAAPADPLTTSDDLPAGWHRIVVRYADGRMAKGYCQDFFPPRGHFHLWQSPSALARERVTIPIGHLKAVFFVRDFDGNPLYVKDVSAQRPNVGRQIAVTFLDDEELAGTTNNYQAGAQGFFIQPLDRGSNNIRAYVVSRAVRHVRFL